MTAAQPPVTHRIAAPADLDLAMELLCEMVLELAGQQRVDKLRPLLLKDFRAALAAPHIIAQRGNEVLGLSRADVVSNHPDFRFEDDPRCGYVDQMFIRQAYRQLGLGKGLLFACEDWFRSQGIPVCFGHANPKAVRLYARLGWKPHRELFKHLRQ